MNKNKQEVKITVRDIVDSNDSARVGFAKTYKEVFAEKPYFENFEIEDIDQNVWLPHIGHCIVVVENNFREVVGFGCAHPFLADTEPSIRDFLVAQKLPFDSSKTIFMSELAVRKEFRRQGIGAKIITARLEWGQKNGYTNFCMRTAEHKSNSRSIYEKIGAKQAPFIQDVSNGKIDTSSKQRVYLWGKISEALIKLK